MVDESNDSLTSLLHLEGGSGDHTIITDMASFDTRVDLDIDRLNIDFVVIDVIIYSNRG
jgi:hypothetical protein